MSPRPRKVSDDDVFAAAYRVMQRVGPDELTLGAIADDAGVTAGALVQRFGSRRALLLSLAERQAAGTGDMMAALRERHRSPLATLRAWADCMADLAASPDALARSLAYLYVDLTDEDLRGHLVTQARATRAALRRLVADAVRQRELTATTTPAALARLVEAVISGSMMSWAFTPEGTARAWIRRDLDAVLAPHVVSTSTATRARRRPVRTRRHAAGGPR